MTVLVTGASSGIGRAIAHALVADGATVIASGRDAARLAATSADSAAPSRCIADARDLARDPEGIDAWVGELARRYGPLSGIVHSAGVLGTTPLRVLKLEAAARVIELNVLAFVMLAKGLAADGVSNPRGATLVAMSSVASLRGLSSSVAYSASKGALNAAVQSLAIELAPLGIRCNAILPGVVETEMTEDVDTEQIQYLLDQQFVPGRIQPGDIAALCAYLMSDDGRFVTGQHIVVDAGSGHVLGPRPFV
jgi:NAD(P)-dependent dehydrogenase (short-subunit alcohol dehydrogenase family)